MGEQAASAFCPHAARQPSQQHAVHRPQRSAQHIDAPQQQHRARCDTGSQAPKHIDVPQQQHRARCDTGSLASKHEHPEPAPEQTAPASKKT
jgi:hypothetical protein